MKIKRDDSFNFVKLSIKLLLNYYVDRRVYEKISRFIATPFLARLQCHLLRAPARNEQENSMAKKKPDPFLARPDGNRAQSVWLNKLQAEAGTEIERIDGYVQTKETQIYSRQPPHLI
jgi:hypothetical protein